MTITATDLARTIRKVHLAERKEVFAALDLLKTRSDARALAGDPIILETVVYHRIHEAHSAVLACAAGIERDSKRLTNLRRSLADATPKLEDDGTPWVPGDNLSLFNLDELPVRIERAKAAVEIAARTVLLFEQLGDRITSTEEERKAAKDAALTALWKAQPSTELVRRARAASYSFGGTDRNTIIRVLVEHGEVP